MDLKDWCQTCAYTPVECCKQLVSMSSCTELWNSLCFALSWLKKGATLLTRQKYKSPQLYWCEQWQQQTNGWLWKWLHFGNVCGECSLSLNHETQWKILAQQWHAGNPPPRFKTSRVFSRTIRHCPSCAQVEGDAMWKWGGKSTYVGLLKQGKAAMLNCPRCTTC